jgi:hypothetical protein
MKTLPRRSYFNPLRTSMLLMLSTIILFGCSQQALAQQRDGDAADTTSSSAPSGRVNFNIIQLMNGEYLEMFGAGTSSGRLRGHPSIPGVELSTTTADPLMFSTSGVERMRIAANGFVGIGINNPATPLEMYTPAAVSYSPTQTQTARARFINSAVIANSVFELNLGSFDTNNVPSSVVRLVSIMTSNTPAATSGDFAIGLRKLGTLFEIARFTSTGRVGLGTTNPQDAFHVFNTTNNVGTMRLQGGNTNAGFIGMWDQQSLLLSNNRHPGTGANFNTAATGAQMSLWGGDAVFYTTTSGAIGNATELMRINALGRVGIGTSTPGFKVDVQGGAINASGGLCIASDCKTSWAQVGGGGSSQWTTSGANIFYNSGNVGIGTSSPTSKLHVAGDGRVTGNFTVDGNIAAKYQDVAEWVPAATQLAVGTVVVLDATTSNQVISSNSSYDTRVAGVISAQPGIVLGEKSDNKVLVATTGRVRVKVDATNGPIQIGDLLVTGTREGFAMKSLPVEIGGVRMHRPGTLIGKALEPLASGTGEILVLLSLQ